MRNNTKNLMIWRVKLQFMKKTINILLIKCDNIEQKSRRNCLRIHGIECKSNKNNEDVTEKVRSSRPKVFCKKGVHRNFSKFTGKHLCQSLFFNKVDSLLKKRLWHRCFPVNFAKFLRTPFLKEHLSWLLLKSKRMLQSFRITSLLRKYQSCTWDP